MAKKKKLALHWKILLGMLLGVIYGLIAAQAEWLTFTDDYIKPLGTIFINLLKLISELHDIGKIAIDDSILNKP